MATDTAAAPAPTHTHTDPTRHLWQLPVLLLGIAAFVCTWKGWLPPIGEIGDGPSPARDIASLKSAHEKVTPDPTELKNLLAKVALGVESYPAGDVPLARFHLGSGYVRLAEITAAPDESRGYWMLALQHFELVTEKQLRDPADGPRLIFRAAKATAAVGLSENTPSAEIDQLMAALSAPPPGEEAGEAQRLVAELALRRNPQDPGRAKIALTQYLTATGVSTPPASLSRARLVLGSLYYQSTEYELARKWLSEVGNESPEVMAPAKAMLARVLMADKNWLAAVRELDTLRGAPGVPPALRLTAAYQLGVCRLELKDREAARRLFEEAAKGEGPEASAGAIQLTKLHCEGTDRARHKSAADLLAGAFKGVDKPANYNGALIPLNEAQAACELAVTTLLADGEYDSALRVAETYAAIASPGRDREKRAEILSAWGESLLKAKKFDEAKAKFKAAATEFAALVAYQPRSDGQVEMLRRSAALSRKAENPDAATERLQAALKLKGIPEAVLQTLWVELADALLAAGRPGEVPKLFNKIMSEQTPISTATRYRLARAFIESRHPGLVETGRQLFKQIAEQKEIKPEEREYHERSLTELASALIREGNFADGEARLRLQLGFYPNGPEAPLARLLLGICLLQRAAATTTPPTDAAKMRAEALTYFKKIVSDCDVIEQRPGGKLTEREAWLRLQAALRVLQTHQQMKKPLELLADAAPLLDRHKNTVDELIILSLVFHAFRQMNDPGKALDTRARMKEAFDRLPPSAFTAPEGEYSREYWQKMWFAPDAK
jgi:tetratricopeptide (TPR) repeat protein